MQVFVKQGETTIILDMKTTDDVQHVKALLYNREKRLTFAGKQLENGRTLSAYNIESESMLWESERLMGGGGGYVRKQILKTKHHDKGAALKGMQAKIRGEIATAMDTNEVDDEACTPAVVEIILKPLREKIAKLEASSNGGQIAGLVKILTDKQLDEVVKILGKKSGVLQSERVMQLAHSMISELERLDANLACLMNAKSMLVMKFADVLTSEFNTEGSTGLTLNCAALKIEVDKVASYRCALRDLVANTPGASLPEVLAPPEAAQGSLCSVM